MSLNIFQQVFANVNRRTSDLLMAENEDPNILVPKKVTTQKKKLNKVKRTSPKKKAAAQKAKKSQNSVAKAIEPVLQAEVISIDSAIDATVSATLDEHHQLLSKLNVEPAPSEIPAVEEKIDDHEIFEDESKSSDIHEEKESINEITQENKEEIKEEIQEKIIIETVQKFADETEINDNYEKEMEEEDERYEKAVHINKPETIQTPGKKENESKIFTPKSSRLPKKIDSIPSNKCYIDMPTLEIIPDDMTEDEMKIKLLYLSENLYATQKQLEEANEKNKQLEDRVYQLEMMLNEERLKTFERCE